MNITACRAGSDTVRVGVSWSHLPSTGGQIFINTAPLESKYDVTWNQKGKQGSRSEDIFINGDIVDIVTVNLYNARDPNNITFEQRVIGDGNNLEEILPCSVLRAPAAKPARTAAMPSVRVVAGCQCGTLGPKALATRLEGEPGCASPFEAFPHRRGSCWR